MTITEIKMDKVWFPPLIQLMVKTKQMQLELSSLPLYFLLFQERTQLMEVSLSLGKISPKVKIKLLLSLTVIVMEPWLEQIINFHKDAVYMILTILLHALEWTQAHTV